MEPYTWIFIASIKKQVLIEWALPLILGGSLKERGRSLCFGLDILLRHTVK